MMKRHLIVACMCAVAVVQAGCGSSQEQDDSASSVTILPNSPAAQQIDQPTPTHTTASESDISGPVADITMTMTVTPTATFTPTLVVEPATLTTLATLNIRAGPSTEYAVVGNFAGGARCHDFRHCIYWYMVAR